MSQQQPMNSIFNTLEKKDKQVLNKILQKGYLNPYDEFPGAMSTGDIRRYIQDFVEVPYTDIEENQVATEIVNKKRCREEIAPSIEKFGLRNPPIVIESTTPNKYKLVTGHHRSYSMDMLGKLVPCIVVTKNYNLTGGSVSSDIDILQGVKANPAPEHRGYSIEDAALVIQGSMDLNKTQDGNNPSGKLPPREDKNGFDFDDLMDRVFGPHYFPHKGTRTKIYNRCLRGKTKHKLIDMDFSEQSAHLGRIGYNPGIKSNGKRYGSTEHFDPKRNAMIIMSDDNGRHLNEKMFGIVEKWHDRESNYCEILKQNNINYVDVVARIYKPPVEKANLDTKRAAFQKSVEKWVNLLPSCGVKLKVRYLAFPKQLKVASDQDFIVTL
tara:strand:- start:731 stop:1873 length:1143 start_codon:yes stop_codon:yes gene_type:complete